MRILWFTNTPSLASEYLQSKSNGGGWISSLEKEIAKVKEIQLGIVFHYDSDENKNFTIEKTQYFSLPNHEVNGKINRLLKRWMHQIESENIIDDYLKIVEQFKPDLIHIFGTEQAFGLIIDRLKVPAIIQIQGNLTVIYKKWFSGISSIDIFRYSSIKGLIRGRGLWHDYLTLAKRVKREQKIFEICKFFIGRTSWDKHITIALSKNGEYFHCDELMRDLFYQNYWVEPNNKKTIFFSTIKSSTYKGLETILETASILKKKNKIDFEWHIAGINAEDELIKILEKTKRLKFSEQKIIFKGPLNLESILNNLLQANCYIHPSHIENSPNSVCEAMLLGMPIIATYAGGTPSLIQNNQEGLLIQDGDPYAFVGAILELSENKEHAIEMGTNARASALIRHNHERVVTDLLNIYNSILLKYNIQNS